jgi:hypothetical protein
LLFTLKNGSMSSGLTSYRQIESPSGLSQTVDKHRFYAARHESGVCFCLNIFRRFYVWSI